MIPYRLYFIRRPDSGDIKIGISREPVRRHRDIQAANGRPLVLVGSILGGSDEEDAVHAAFADCRLLNEWFHETPRLTAFVAKLLGPPHPTAARCHLPSSIAERHFDACMTWLEDEDAHEEALKINAESHGGAA